MSQGLHVVEDLQHEARGRLHHPSAGDQQRQPHADGLEDDPEGHVPQAGHRLQHRRQAAVGIDHLRALQQDAVELLAPDVKVEPYYRYVDALPETQSEVALPLKIEDRVLGILDVQSNHLDGFHEMDMLVLRSLADNVALAIDSARLYSSLQQRAATAEQK